MHPTLYVSNKTSSQMRRGTVAIKHVADANKLPVCGAKLRETWVLGERELQHLLCEKCKHLEGRP